MFQIARIQWKSCGPSAELIRQLHEDSCFDIFFVTKITDFFLNKLSSSLSLALRSASVEFTLRFSVAFSLICNGSALLFCFFLIISCFIDILLSLSWAGGSLVFAVIVFLAVGFYGNCWACLFTRFILFLFIFALINCFLHGFVTLAHFLSNAVVLSNALR